MATKARRKPIERVTESKQEQVLDRYPFRHSLDTGDRGPLVLWTQSQLAELGYYEGPLDGKYSREVNLAVRQFQSDKSLVVTGVVSRRTWEALQQ